MFFQSPVVPRRGPAALAICICVMAADLSKADAQDSVFLPAIDVVSATLIPTPADQTASSVTVITAADLEREQRRTVADALTQVPGLNVVQSGGPGSQTAIFIRGTNSNHVKVLIDGIDVGDPSTPNGAFDFGHLLTGDIERIEVLRGPQSGLYGSDAIGGVISITTKKGEGPAKTTGSLEGGSFGAFNQSAGVSGSQGIFNYALNVQHFRSTDTPVTPLDLLAPGERRNNDTYNNWTYSTRLGAQVADNLALNFIGRYTDAGLGFTGEDYLNFGMPAPEALQSRQTDHDAYIRGEAVWSLFDGRFKNFFGVSYTNQRRWAFNPNPDGFPPAPPVAPPTTNVGQRTKIDWRGEAKMAPGQTLVVGLERQTDTLHTDSTADVFPTFVQTTTTASTGNTAGYVELQSEIAKQLFVTANIRHDDNASFGGHNTWRVAPAFIVPVTGTKLKASYGTGFKAPTLTELFVSNPAFLLVGNPNLAPELSKGYDIGFEQPLWRGRASVGVTYFHNNIRDLIVSMFEPNLIAFSYENIGRAETHGVEAFAAATITSEIKVRADYTYTRAVDQDTGLELLRRPRNKATLSTIWTPNDRFSLSGTVLYVSSWVDTDRSGFTSRLNAPGYTTVNLAANYRVDKNVSVFGRVDNLLDRHYQVPVGFLRPGLGIFGGAHVTY